MAAYDGMIHVCIQGPLDVEFTPKQDIEEVEMINKRIFCGLIVKLFRTLPLHVCIHVAVCAPAFPYLLVQTSMSLWFKVQSYIHLTLRERLTVKADSLTPIPPTKRKTGFCYVLPLR